MIIKSIPYQDSLSIFSRFSLQPWSLWLDSAQTNSDLGRYSFIAVDPFATLTSKNGVIRFLKQNFNSNPFNFLKQEFAKYSSSHIQTSVPFPGGIAGYFGYELNQHIESIKPAKQDDCQFPDLALGFYDVVIGFDHLKKQAWICSTGLPEKEPSARQYRAEKRIKEFNNRISNFGRESFFCQSQSLPSSSITAQSNFTHKQYIKAVQQVVDYIYAGDIFEANISQRFSARLPSHFSPFELYQRLRRNNPAPFAAYFNPDEVIIASSSPERFIQLHGRQVETRPIKGTRRRGATLTEDQQLADELVASVKDQAENVMIVDLMRNDLSKVCENHSVKVPTLCGLVTFANVHHLVSVITGKLKSDKTAIDLLQASFPGGSITGAPKIRTMEIIAEIEPHVRGPYCGSVGYIGFDGSMDTSITIRTFAIKKNHLTFHGGGAITADSDPEQEYQETLAKVAALQKIIHEFY